MKRKRNKSDAKWIKKNWPISITPPGLWEIIKNIKPLNSSTVRPMVMELLGAYGITVHYDEEKNKMQIRY